jgi:hypothetical protein
MTPGQTVARTALIATLAATFPLLPLSQTPPAHAATNGHRGGNYVAGVNGPILVLVGRGGLGLVVVGWVVAGGDAHRRHVRVLATVNGPIASPAWSPDGRAIAYITGSYTGNGGTEIRIIDVASATTRVVLSTMGPRQRMLPPASQFVRLAWMHIRA